MSEKKFEPTPEQIEYARKSILEAEDDLILGALKNAANHSINLDVDEEIKYVSDTIRNALGVELIGQGDPSLAQEVLKKQFNDSKELLKTVIGEKIKEHLEENGIDSSDVEITIQDCKVSYENGSIVVEEIKFK